MVSVVADTNVLISNLITEGFERKVINLASSGKIDLIISEDIFSELKRVLSYPHLRFLAPKVEEALAQYRTLATFVSPSEKLMIVADDPTDNKIVEAAVAGLADYIITGDNHLLKLKEFREIHIRTAKQFLSEVILL